MIKQPCVIVVKGGGGGDKGYKGFRFRVEEGVHHLQKSKQNR